jgi:hypothetical protein
MNHKVGDTVRIQTQEWFEAQEKDEDGNIHGDGDRVITPCMQHFAGRKAKILSMGKKSYDLGIGVKGELWEKK